MMLTLLFDPPMNNLKSSLLPAVCCIFAVLTSPTNAAVVLTNGSFESTDASLNPALGGLLAASDWTNLTGNAGVAFQASSALAGNPPNPEFTSPPGAATGARYLRLAADPGGSAIWGKLGQLTGMMVTGETYLLRADIYAGPGDGGQLYGAKISLVNEVSATPSFTYATQTVDGLADTTVGLNAFNFSYTATAADNGQPLVVLLEALDNGASNQSRRGGLDNLRLTVVPEPSVALLSGAAGLALLRRRRA